MPQSEAVIGAIRTAHRDRAIKAARMLATIFMQEYLVVEISGMSGVFHAATEQGLRSLQNRDQIGTYQTHFRAVPFECQPPTVERIEYRFGKVCWVFTSGGIVYDDRENTGEFVVSEGALSSLPLAEALNHLYGGVARCRSFPEAVILMALFAAGMVKPEYEPLIKRGVLRVG